MIKPDDVEGLSYFLERIFFDDDYYYKQKEYGLQRSKLFSWKKSANRTFEIYEEILNK
jgi:glycosyltransferase involved in cell wall biosynthesis